MLARIWKERKKERRAVKVCFIYSKKKERKEERKGKESCLESVSGALTQDSGIFFFSYEER